MPTIDDWQTTLDLTEQLLRIAWWCGLAVGVWGVIGVGAWYWWTVWRWR